MSGIGVLNVLSLTNITTENSFGGLMGFEVQRYYYVEFHIIVTLRLKPRNLLLSVEFPHHGLDCAELDHEE